FDAAEITDQPFLTQQRVRLTWGFAPKDVDLHLVGPDGTGGTCHVYFDDMQCINGDGLKVASLDRDDTDSFGPETITVWHTRQISGTYRVYLHDFTNRASSSSSALGGSDATVGLFAGLVGSFAVKLLTVPNSSGTVWAAFEFTVAGGKVTSTRDLGSMSYERTAGRVGTMAMSSRADAARVQRDLARIYADLAGSDARGRAKPAAEPTH
ncbi:MAG: hypothetical protein LBK59_01230, partial [Bifidobacteriaceae bacterium]|nr:hypothetical protein [Bifidobacteriaceae bacterium]